MIQIMENFLFSMKNAFDIWLNSSPTWAIETILAFLCGLGLFFLLLPLLQSNPSLPPPRTYGNIRRHQMEPRGRRRSRKKNGALKACRDCLEELKEVRGLISHLQSHLGRFTNKGSFHQLCCQDSPDEVCQAAPTGAQQPCRGPAEEVAPAMSQASLTKWPPHQASTLSLGSKTSTISVHSRSSLSASQPPEPLLPLDSPSPQPLAPSSSPPHPPEAGTCPPPLTASSGPPPQDSTLSLNQYDPKALPLGTIPRSSSPLAPWRPAISGTGRSNCPISALSWWQMAAKSWSLSTLTRFESRQEHLLHHPPETPFWVDTSNRQVEAASLSFVNPNVQKLLEILISKRVELKIWKKKEERSDYHLNSLGKTFKSLGGQQDSKGQQHFWSIKGKPEQLLGSEMPPHPASLGDHLQKKCSQLFWGLPFLHSESLVATLTVAGSPLELPPVLFNECSKAKPLEIQTKVTSHPSLAQPLPHPGARARPQLLPPTMPHYQPSALANMETQARPQTFTPTMPQCHPPPLASMKIQARPQPLTATMPQRQSPPLANMDIQARPQTLTATMPQRQSPPLANMDIQARPQTLTATMPQCQPPPLANMKIQARPQTLTATMPQRQSPPLANMDTQARPQTLTATMPQRQSLPLANMDTQARPQTLIATMPQRQPPPLANIDTQARPQTLTATVPQRQSPPLANMDTQARPQTLTATVPQRQSPPLANMDIQAQPQTLTATVPQRQSPPLANMDIQARPQTLTATMPQRQSPLLANMDTQARPQTLTATMPQRQPPPLANMKIQARPQTLTATMPQRQSPPLANMIHTRPQTLTATMPQRQPPPLANMKIQARPQTLTATMPQRQSPPLANMDTQAGPQTLTATMPQCQSPPLANMDIQARPQTLTATMPQHQSPPLANMEIHTRPQTLIATMPQCQPPPLANMEIQARPQTLTPHMSQFHPPPLAHMKTEDQPQPLTPTIRQCQPSPLAQFQNQAQPQPLIPMRSHLQPPLAHMETQSIPWIPTMPQCQPPHLAHMETQAQPQTLTPIMSQFQCPLVHVEIPAQPQPQPLPPTISKCRPSSLAQLDTPAHLTPSLQNLPSSSQPQVRYSEVSFPTVQNKSQSFIPSAIQGLECHFLKKQLEKGKTLPSLVKKSQQVFNQVVPNISQDNKAPQAYRPVSVPPRALISPEVQEKLEQHLLKRCMQQQSGLPYRIQVSQKLMQSQDKPPGPCQTQGKKGPSRPSAFVGKSSQSAQKMGFRGSASIPAGRDLGQDVGQSIGKILKDLYMTSASPLMKVTRVKTESVRGLGLDQNHPEKTLGVFWGRKAEQICKGQIPMDVHHSRLAANRVHDFPGKSNVYKGTINPNSSRDQEPYLIVSHESFVLSPRIQQVLEAHTIKFRMKHNWGLLLKVLKFINLLKLKKAHPIALPGSNWEVTCKSEEQSKAQLSNVLEKRPEPHLREEITTESVSILVSPLPAPSPESKDIQGPPVVPPPGNGPKPAEAPLTEQKLLPPSQTPTSNFVSRIWHSESVMGVGKGSLENLEPSPHPATAGNEPREEAGRRPSLDSCSSVTVVDLDAQPPSVGESDPAWRRALKSSVTVNSHIFNVNLKRSRSPGSNKSASSRAKSGAPSPGDQYIDTWFRKLEFQGFPNSQKQPPDVLLQDCETGVLLEDCTTHMLLKDYHPDTYQAKDILTSEESGSCSPTLSSGDTSISQLLYDRGSSGGSSQGQQEPLRWKAQYKSPSKKFVITTERENYRRPKLGQYRKGLAERRAYQAREMSHPGQKKESVESLKSRSLQLMLKKGQTPSESHFRKRMKHILQWIFPSKDKEPQAPPPKDKPAVAAAQSQGRVKSKLFMDSGAAEAQALMTAVGRILEEKVALHHGPHASRLNWYKGELQAPLGPHHCYHRYLSYEEQRRVMRDTPCDHQVTPKGHSCPNKSEWTHHRDSKWAFSHREPGPPGTPYWHGPRVTSVPGRPLHCPRHCLLGKYTTSLQSERACQSFPGRTTLHQGKMHTVQRKTYFSHVSTSSVC